MLDVGRRSGLAAGPGRARAQSLLCKLRSISHKADRLPRVVPTSMCVSVFCPFISGFAVSPHEPRHGSVLTKFLHFSIAECDSSGFDDNRLVPSFF